MQYFWNVYIEPHIGWPETITLFSFFDYWIGLLLPAVTVLAAVFWTQKTFHRNASLRENRERRLKRVEDMIEKTCEADNHISNFLSAKYSMARKEAGNLTVFLNYMYAYNTAYNLDVAKETTKVTECLSDITERYLKRTVDTIENRQEDVSEEAAKSIARDVSIAQAMHDDGNFKDDLRLAQRKLLTKLTAIHKEIESEHIKQR